MSRDSESTTEFSFLAENAVDTWYSEIKKYNFKNPSGGGGTGKKLSH